MIENLIYFFRMFLFCTCLLGLMFCLFGWYVLLGQGKDEYKIWLELLKKRLKEFKAVYVTIFIMGLIACVIVTIFRG